MAGEYVCPVHGEDMTAAVNAACGAKAQAHAAVTAFRAERLAKGDLGLVAPLEELIRQLITKSVRVQCPNGTWLECSCPNALEANQNAVSPLEIASDQSNGGLRGSQLGG